MPYIFFSSGRANPRVILLGHQMMTSLEISSILHLILLLLSLLFHAAVGLEQKPKNSDCSRIQLPYMIWYFWQLKQDQYDLFCDHQDVLMRALKIFFQQTKTYNNNKQPLTNTFNNKIFAKCPFLRALSLQVWRKLCLRTVGLKTIFPPNLSVIIFLDWPCTIVRKFIS